MYLLFEILPLDVINILLAIINSKYEQPFIGAHLLFMRLYGSEIRSAHYFSRLNLKNVCQQWLTCWQLSDLPVPAQLYLAEKISLRIMNGARDKFIHKLVNNRIDVIMRMSHVLDFIVEIINMNYIWAIGHHYCDGAYLIRLYLRHAEKSLGGGRPVRPFIKMSAERVLAKKSSFTYDLFISFLICCEDSAEKTSALNHVYYKEHVAKMFGAAKK